MQSYGMPQIHIPKIPPRSMLAKGKLVLISNNWILSGKTGKFFLDMDSSLTYDEYRSLVLSPTVNKKEAEEPKTSGSEGEMIQECQQTVAKRVPIVDPKFIVILYYI